MLVEASVGNQLFGDLPRIRVGRVSMRIVGLEHDLAHADDISADEAMVVIEDAAVDAVHVTARALWDAASQSRLPDGRLRPDPVHALEFEWHPSDLPFAQRNPQLGVAGEDSRQQPVSQGGRGVKRSQGPW